MSYDVTSLVQNPLYTDCLDLKTWFSLNDAAYDTQEILYFCVSSRRGWTFSVRECYSCVRIRTLLALAW